jgi:hypothetical protein
MLNEVHFSTEVLTLSGQFLVDLRSAAQNLRDYYRECSPAEVPNVDLREDALDRVARFLDLHQQVSIEAEATDSGGVGVVIAYPDDELDR